MRPALPVLLLCSCAQTPFHFEAPQPRGDAREEAARALIACGKEYSPVIGRRDGAVVTQWELSDLPANDPDRNGPEDIARRYRVVVTPGSTRIAVDVRVELGLDRGGHDRSEVDPNTHTVLGDCTEEKLPGTQVFRCAAIEPRGGAACDKDRNCIGELEPMTVIPAYELAARDKLATCVRNALAPPAAPL